MGVKITNVRQGNRDELFVTGLVDEVEVTAQGWVTRFESLQHDLVRQRKYLEDLLTNGKTLSSAALSLHNDALSAWEKTKTFCKKNAWNLCLTAGMIANFIIEMVVRHAGR
jgi:hypothetical protein